MPAKEVNTVFEWHISHAIVPLGIWVDDDGEVGDPPAAKGIAIG
jgi:hypothetical protein